MTTFFIVDERSMVTNITLSGPSLAFCWRDDDGLTLNAGLAAL